MSFRPWGCKESNVTEHEQVSVHLTFGHNLGRDGQQKGKASFLLFYLNTYFISSKSSFFSSEDPGVLCDVGGAQFA